MQLESMMEHRRAAFALNLDTLCSITSSGKRMTVCMKCKEKIIAVYTYRLVMISINLSETAHFAHWKSETTSETNFFLTIIFLINFFLD